MEADLFSGKGGKIFSIFPFNFHFGTVPGDGQAILFRKALHSVSFFIQNFGKEFSSAAVHIDKKTGKGLLKPEFFREDPGPFRRGIHGGKAIPPEECHSGCTSVVHTVFSAAALIALESGKVEVDLILIHGADISQALDIASVPFFSTAAANGAVPIRSGPVEAIPAVSKFQFRDFGDPRSFAHIIGGTVMKLEEAQHKAFVGGCIQIVKLGGYIGGAIYRVGFFRTSPVDCPGFGVFSGFASPLGGGNKIISFGIIPHPLSCKVRPEAEAPFFPEGIVEHGASVSGNTRCGGV